MNYVSSLEELDELHRELHAYQREWSEATAEGTKAKNQRIAGVRNILGYDTLMEEEEREKTEKLGDKIIDAADGDGSMPEDADGNMDLAYEYAVNQSRVIESWDRRKERANKMLIELATQLPVWEWAETVKGFGPAWLGKLAGGITPSDEYDGICFNQFSNKSKVHQYFRHTVKPRKDGSLKRGLDASGELESILYLTGEYMIRQKGYYYDLYMDRKEYEIERDHSNGLYVLGKPRTVKTYKEKGLPDIYLKSELPDYLSSLTYDKIRNNHEDEVVFIGHLNKRSKRYMRRKFIRDLWQAWKRLTVF